MSDYSIVPNAALTETADAIRTKSGSQATIEFDHNTGFKDAVDAIPSGGINFDDFLSGAEPSGTQVADTVDIVGPYMCYNRTGITSLTSSSITTIREQAFQGCSNLEEVILPNLEYFRQGATGTNENGNPGSCFRDCKLRHVYLPKLKYMYARSVFLGATNGGTDSDPAVYVLPALETALHNTWSNAHTIIVDLGPSVPSINSDCFYDGNLSSNNPKNTLILRRTADAVAAQNTDSIRSIKYLYVPQDLVETYQTATNWSTRYSAGYLQINAIEGSQYENYYADGTLIPT